MRAIDQSFSRRNASWAHGRQGGKSAFTLVEILMVVIILGIASAIIVPNLGTRNDMNVAAAARVIMADLMYAQNRAIVTQSMTYVPITVATQQYAITSSKPNASPVVYVMNPVTGQNYITKFSSATNPGLQPAALQAVNIDAKACIAFDELGQPYSWDPATGNSTALVNPATIPVKCGNFLLTVSVEPYTGALTVN
jgi:prepilin-type N-terminal cleavage/methylation domain-containing protein